MAPPILTVGHSTRTLEAFLELLRAHDVRLLVDVRRFPGSRRHPHFGGPALEAALAEEGIGYLHLPELGGRRRPAPDSRNDAWRVEGFRGYADHAEGPEFAEGFARLLEAADALASGHAALMCAEALPERCHRRLIADRLVAGGREVRHILGTGRTRAHVLPPFARVQDGAVTYPAGNATS